MQVETGQLRVWDDAITLDKTPFLVLERMVYPDALVRGDKHDDWQILWRGKLSTWSTHRIKMFSEIIDTSCATAG